MRETQTHNKPVRSRRRTLKILLAVILLLAAAIAASLVYSYRSTENSLTVSFTEDSPSVEAGGTYAAMDFVDYAEGEVTPSAEYLDTETTGDREIVYTVSQPLFGGLMTPEREFTLTYTVADTVAPLMLWSGDGTVLERGTEFDINNVIGYGDNADPEPAVKVDGDVDMNSNGSYPLHVTVTDASGNSTDWDLTVTVAASVPVYTDTSARTQFSSFASAYAGDGRTFGIDVSTWQGDIDFKAVRDAGCEFVIIRIGYSADGKVEEDSKFEQNLERAKKAGLKVGIYLYSYDDTEEEVISSADWIVQKLDGTALDLPVVFDWEDFGHFQTHKMSFTQLNGLYDAFAQTIEAAGYDCMLYGSKTYLENVWEDTNTRPVWLAHYTDETDYKGSYVIWQASSTGRIDGIDGDVDMDIMFE